MIQIAGLCQRFARAAPRSVLMTRAFPFVKTTAVLAKS